MLKKLSALFVVALFSLSVAACGGKGNCEKVVDHMIKLTTQDLPEEVRAETVKQMQKEKKELVKKCEEEGLTKKQEECALKAKNIGDLAKCDSK